jgi:hypothetical protein
MYMVGHDDKSLQMVSLSIKLQERIRNDLGELNLTKETTPVTAIKVLMPPLVLELLESSTNVLGSVG